MNPLKIYLSQFFRHLANDEKDVQLFGVKVSKEDEKNRNQIARLLFVSGWIMRLEASNLYATKRDIYYTNVVLFNKKQRALEQTIRTIQQTLSLSDEQLRLKSSSKGLVHGPLHIQTRDGFLLDCNAGHETLIPSKESIINIELKASSDWIIIVVEKDAFFQFLVQNKNQLDMLIKKEILFITGKGFPCASTTYLLHLIGIKYQNVMQFAIVDLDPSGLYVFKTFKLGGARTFSSPSLRYLGLKPADLEHYGCYDGNTAIPFTARDKALCKSLLRLEFNRKVDFCGSLDFLLAAEQKFEIEAMYQNRPVDNVLRWLSDEVAKQLNE